MCFISTVSITKRIHLLLGFWLRLLCCLLALGLLISVFGFTKKQEHLFSMLNFGYNTPPPEEGGWGGVKATKGYVNDFGQEGQFFQKVVAMLNQKSSAKHWGEPAHFSGESVRAV
jgi:hypothetical protein